MLAREVGFVTTAPHDTAQQPQGLSGFSLRSAQSGASGGGLDGTLAIAALAKFAKWRIPSYLLVRYRTTEAAYRSHLGLCSRLGPPHHRVK